MEENVKCKNKTSVKSWKDFDWCTSLSHGYVWKSPTHSWIGLDWVPNVLDPLVFVSKTSCTSPLCRKVCGG